MKTIITAIALAAGLTSAHANPAQTSAPTLHATLESLMATYTPREPFIHVADERSYVGTFEAVTGACALTVQFGPLGLQNSQQIVFELPARQTISFGGGATGSAVRFSCADDAQSLVVIQTWTPAGDAKAASLEE